MPWYFNQSTQFYSKLMKNMDYSEVTLIKTLAASLNVDFMMP